jgi:hypothetical protein
MGLNLSAQDFLSWRYSDRYFSLSIGTGNAAYFGELNEPNRIQKSMSIISTGLEARLWSKVSGRVEMAYYGINGSDQLAPDSSFNQQRNLSFESRNFEGSIQGLFYLKDYQGDYFRRFKTEPYLAVGVGFTTFNPVLPTDSITYTLRDIQTEGVSYGKTVLTIPLGAGLKFRINEFVNFNLEAAFRFTFTDYLDDVSTIYPDFGENLESLISNRKFERPGINPEAFDALVPGAPRGDSSNNDHYLLLNVKLEVYLPTGKGILFRKPSAY